MSQSNRFLNTIELKGLPWDTMQIPAKGKKLQFD